MLARLSWMVEDATPPRRARGQRLERSDLCGCDLPVHLPDDGQGDRRRVRACQPVLTIAEAGKQWLSFNAREDLLHGLTVGSTVDVARLGVTATMPAVVTELRSIEAFTTWQAERAVADHDRNTPRLRLDPQGDATGLEPGMTV
jgi:hypothetical protein